MQNGLATKLTWVFGVVFVVVGILGFITNPIMGATGFFMTNLWHNLVHLVTGVVAIIFAMQGEGSANMFLKVFGVIYLLVAVLGLVLIGANSQTNLLGFLTVNAADNWLHVVLGVVILGAGFLTTPKGNQM